MKIKVCGMKYNLNIKELTTLDIDFMGMIFYSKSPRNIKLVDDKRTNISPINIEKVGVFVNEKHTIISYVIDTYNLDSIQLHGTESVAFCQELRASHPNVKLIKAFSIASETDFEQVEQYKNTCDLFLFDTKTPSYGGSGESFDWELLNAYKGDIPFFLSGGIKESDAEKIKKINHPQFYGIDINSRFEIEPGLKDIEQIKRFIKKIRS